MSPEREMPKREIVVRQLAEVFREYGYEGTTLSIITGKTGLGKGSLYHFFPGGKEEMAEAVLTHINEWFETQIFEPLDSATSPGAGLSIMLQNVTDYFESGERICIVGMFALGESRDRYSKEITRFFDAWRKAVLRTLRKAGVSKRRAESLAIEVLVAIQGGLVLSRASDDTEMFRTTIERLKASLRDAIAA